MTRRAAGGPWLSVDAGDDAAVVHGQAVSTDTMVEGTHFDARSTPADVGYKAIAVSVSDIVAMGARPQWALLALTLPRDLDPADFADDFATGVTLACGAYGVRLVGGDVTGGRGPRVITSVVSGPCPRPVRRDGARVGDDVWVTGTLGLAGAGWMWSAPPPEALDRLRRPHPPIRFAEVLRDLAHAAMDLSDGLATDAPRLARASGCGLHLDLDALPTATVLLGHDPTEVRHAQLTGGEDYEVLFTAPPTARDALRDRAAAVDVRVTRIGAVTPGAGVTTSEGSLPTPGFAHFPLGGGAAA